MMLVYINAAQAQNAQELSRGQQWLLAQVELEGTVHSGPEQYASTLQAAAEMIRAFRLNNTIPAKLVDQVATGADDSTDNLARHILALKSAGRSPAAQLAHLAKLQNADGGFGGALNYTSDVLDTALALSALSNSAADAGTAASTVEYLLANQRSSGAFGFAAGPDDIALTGLVVSAMQLSAADMKTSVAIDRAASWLRSRQNTDGGFGSVLESALVQLALLGTNSDSGILSMNRSFLLAQQRPEGSWDGDLYLTAVVLRALTPGGAGTGTGSLTGVARDAASGASLAARVALDGGSPAAVDATGRFTLVGVKPGPHTLTVAADGFAAREFTIDARADTLLDMGNIGLSAVSSTGVLTGIVRADNGSALAGVLLQVSGAATVSAYSAADGRYRVTGVAPGAIRISASKSGYVTAQADATIQAGMELDFSPSLKTAPGSARVSGTVVDSATGAALAGAIVTASGQTMVTTADGRYSFGGLTVGTLSMQVSAPGYIARSYALVVDTLAEFTLPAVALSKSSQPSTTGSVSGLITAKSSGLPLTGVVVTIAGASSTTAATSADGSYRVDGIEPGVIAISVAHPGYTGAGGTATLQAGQTILFSSQLEATSTPGVRVNVVDSVSHLPLAQATVALGSQTQLTDVGGNVVFATVPSGYHTLTLSASDYATRQLPVQTDGKTALDLKTIELARTSLQLPLAGTVTDQASGKPVAGAEVAVIGTRFRTATAIDGSYRIEGLPQGDVTVRFSAPDYITGTAMYTLSPYSPAAQDHALVSGQAGGITLALTADGAKYQAYAPVTLSAELHNEASTTTDVRIGLVVQDGAGKYIASIPATWLDPSGVAQAVFHLQPGATKLTLDWNTLAHAPGVYRIAVRVTRAPAPDSDTAPVQLAEQRLDIDILPTMALGSARITPMPGYATAGAVDQLGYRMEVENRSNVPIATTLAYRLTAPDAALVDSGLVVLNLAPEEATLSRLIAGPQYRYPAAGSYPATLSSTGELVPAQMIGGQIEVAPATNVTPSMLVAPTTIVPAPDQRVHIDLRLHGVEQK